MFICAVCIDNDYYFNLNRIIRLIVRSKFKLFLEMNRTNKTKQIEEWLNDSSVSEYDDSDNDLDFDIDNKTSE